MSWSNARLNLSVVQSTNSTLTSGNQEETLCNMLWDYLVCGDCMSKRLLAEKVLTYTVACKTAPSTKTAKDTRNLSCDLKQVEAVRTLRTRIVTRQEPKLNTISPLQLDTNEWKKIMQIRVHILSCCQSCKTRHLVKVCRERTTPKKANFVDSYPWVRVPTACFVSHVIRV